MGAGVKEGERQRFCKSIRTKSTKEKKTAMDINTKFFTKVKLNIKKVFSKLLIIFKIEICLKFPGAY